MIILIALIIGAGFLFIWKIIAYEKTHHKRQPTLAERKREKEAGILPIKAMQLRHVAGLPAPNGIPVDVVVYSNRICLKASGQLFQIPMERVCEVQDYSDTQLMNSVQSSFFQTLLGAAAFGPTGAVIGAMPESHFRRVVSKYNLLIAFLSEDGKQKALLVASTGRIWGMKKAIQQHMSGQLNWDRVVVL